MPSSNLDSTHGGKSLGVACNHGPCTAHTVGLRQAWQAFIALGKHTWSWNVIIALGLNTQ